MSRRARVRAAVYTAKRMNLIRQPQRQSDEDSFERAMAAVQAQLRAQEQRAVQGAAR